MALALRVGCFGPSHHQHLSVCWAGSSDSFLSGFMLFFLEQNPGTHQNPAAWFPTQTSRLFANAKPAKRAHVGEPTAWRVPLNRSLSFFSPLSPDRSLCFGRLGCSKYLVGSAGGELLCCWNLLTCSCEAASISRVSSRPNGCSS